MVGKAPAADARFNKPNEQASAHYGVLYNGDIWHWVDEDLVAFHTGNYATNQRSIGIEHEDNGMVNGTYDDGPRPEALYKASGKLVRDICSFYKIPIDRQHILKHKEVSDSATACPDALDIDKIISYAKGETPQPPVTYVEVEAKQYEHLVNGATVRKEVATYLEFADPDNAQTDSITRVIAGYKGRITDLQNQLDTKTEEARKATEDLSNEKAKVLSRDQQILTIQKSKDDMEKVMGGRIAELEKAQTAWTAEKTELNKQLLAANQRIEELKLKAVDAMTAPELLIAAIKKLLPFLQKS